MRKIRFKVTELTAPVKQGGKLVVGGIYTGKLGKRGDKVYFTDFNGVDWIFYPNDTCIILP